MRYLFATLLGMLFGITLLKSEVISWFKIQDMFYFRDSHLYLIITSAIIVGGLSLLLIKKFWRGGYDIPEKPFHKGFMIGGFMFGVGWFITGACPGPIYAQIGAGAYPALITLAGALFGAYLYSQLKGKLPH